MLIGAGVAIALAGAVGGFWAGSAFLSSVNSDGIPRWGPAAVSLVLAAAAVATWRPGAPFRLLALYWAAGAASLARPGLRELGLPISGELVDAILGALLILAVALAALALLPDSRIVRLALGTAAGSMAVLLVALWLPAGVVVDTGVYLIIMVSAALSARAATQHRKPAHERTRSLESPL